MPEMLFIINPVSGRGTTLKTWSWARQQLIRAGIQFEEHFTTSAGEATAVTRDAVQKGNSRLIGVGGDGTLNEIVNGYLDEAGKAINPEACLGILPSGTGSDFRRSVGLMKKEDVLRIIIQAKSRTLDAIGVEYRDKAGNPASRFAINEVSFGLGGEVVQLVNDWRGTLPNWIGGRASFVVAAIRALGDFKSKPVKVLIDEAGEFEIQSNLIIAANGRYAGSGMMFAPNAELDDGVMDIILTDGATRLDILKELPRIFRGAHLKNPKVKVRKARTISITSPENLALDIDGEAAGVTPARLRILPAQVRFIF